MRTILLAAMLSALTSCASIYRTNSLNAPYVEAHEDYHVLGFRTVTFKAKCKGVPAQIDEGKSGIQVFLTLLTGGLYNPVTARISCGKKVKGDKA